MASRRSAKYTAFRVCYDSLLNFMKSDVETVARKAFSKNLISEANKRAAENANIKEENRTSDLLDKIISKIQESDVNFEIFISILEEVPVLEFQAGKLRKAVTELDCSDNSNGLPDSPEFSARLNVEVLESEENTGDNSGEADPLY